MPEKINSSIKNFAKKYYVKLTRKVPGEEKRIYKSEKELLRETEHRIKIWDKSPHCRKSTEVIAEKKLHKGKPCPVGQERTKNFCVKKMNPYVPEKTKWVRTISPRKDVRLTLACPR
jgi:hypothetical protein